MFVQNRRISSSFNLNDNISIVKNVTKINQRFNPQLFFDGSFRKSYHATIKACGKSLVEEQVFVSSTLGGGGVVIFKGVF